MFFPCHLHTHSEVIINRDINREVHSEIELALEEIRSALAEEHSPSFTTWPALQETLGGVYGAWSYVLWTLHLQRPIHVHTKLYSSDFNLAQIMSNGKLRKKVNFLLLG